MKAFTEATTKAVLRLLRGGIRYRLFLLVFLIMLPFAGLLGFIFHQRYETRRNLALQAELEVARGLVVTFNNYLNGLRKQSLALGHAIEDLPPSEKKKITRLLTATLRFSPGVRSISWLSPQGVVMSSSAESLVGIDLSDRSSFRQAMATGDLAVGNLAPTGAITPRPTLTISIAIRNESGAVAGVMMTAIEPGRLHEFALTQKRPEGGALAIFDGNGTLVYHTLLTNPSWQERVDWLQGDKILSHVMLTRREEAGIQRIRHLRNEKWVSARVPVPGIRYIVGAGHPAEVAFRDVRTGMLSDALFGTAVFALAFCTAALLGRSISRPVVRLAADARRMGEGETVDGDDPWAPKEVQILREAMTAMSSALIRRSRELQESEASLRTVFDNLNAGILIHDERGQVVAVNQRWLEMARMTREQAEGLTVADVCADPLNYQEVLPMWQKVLSGESMMFEWRGRRPGDGEEFEAEVFLCSIRFNSRDLIMANVRDITERKQVAAELHRYRQELETRVQERTADLAKAFAELEAETERRVAAVEEVRAKEQLIIQQSRLAAMGEMMGKIAHHWRQPLNIIGLMVQDLLLSAQMESLSVQDMEDHTYRIMSVLERLSRSIDEFHNLFSPDTSRTRFAAEEVIETALSLLRDELQHVAVQVERCREGCAIEGFRNQYLQVILNLLANAREILQERNVTSPAIHIAIRRESGRSVVTISDNGGGIDAEIMAKIFDPYFSTRSREKAAGIGLFMAKMIIEKNMGGTLSVRNTADGAEFSVVV